MRHILNPWKIFIIYGIPYFTFFGNYMCSNIVLSLDEFLGVERKVAKYV
jgi:hypothetical protein